MPLEATSIVDWWKQSRKRTHKFNEKALIAFSYLSHGPSGRNKTIEFLITKACRSPRFIA
jgi:hypothetical protein